MTAPTDNEPRSEDASAFVEDFALIMESSGLHRMSARALGAILISETGSMSSRDLAEFLHVSPAAVSNAVRQLEAVQFLRRRRLPGERMDRYELAETPWFESSASQAMVFAQLAGVLRQGRDLVPEDSPARTRLGDSEAFFSYLSRELPRLISNWREAASTQRGEHTP